MKIAAITDATTTQARKKAMPAQKPAATATVAAQMSRMLQTTLAQIAPVF